MKHLKSVEYGANRWDCDIDDIVFGHTYTHMHDLATNHRMNDYVMHHVFFIKGIISHGLPMYVLYTCPGFVTRREKFHPEPAFGQNLKVGVMMMMLGETNEEYKFFSPLLRGFSSVVRYEI